MSQVIALTGATGFLGQHLLQKLLEKDIKVRALARKPEALSHFSNKNLTCIKGDLSSDLSEWIGEADCVLHLAGLVKAKNWSSYEKANVSGTQNVAQTAELLGTKRLVLMSSMAARAPELSFYAKSKYLGEQAAKDFYKGPIAIIRAPAVFGPGDQATKPIFMSMQKGILPTAGGRGWRNRSLAMVYVDDLVEDLIANAVIGAYDDKVVSPSTIKAITMQELAVFASEALQRNVQALGLPLFLLFPVAAITTVTLRLFSIGHLSLGKLAEFRYEHWQSEDIVSNPTDMVDAIKATIKSYNKSG